MKTYTFEKPPSLNQLVNLARRNRYSSAQSKKKWTAKAKKSAIEQGVVKFTSPVWLFVTISYSTATSDVDNAVTTLKPILDGLVEAEVLEDDNIKHINPQLYVTMVKRERKKQFVSVEIFMNRIAYSKKITEDLINGNN